MTIAMPVFVMRHDRNACCESFECDQWAGLNPLRRDSQNHKLATAALLPGMLLVLGKRCAHLHVRVDGFF